MQLGDVCFGRQDDALGSHHLQSDAFSLWTPLGPISLSLQLDAPHLSLLKS